MKLLVIAVLVATSTASFAQQQYIPYPYKANTPPITAQQQQQQGQQTSSSAPVTSAIGVPNAPEPNAPSPNAPTPTAPSPNAPDWTIPANKVGQRPDMPVNQPIAQEQPSSTPAQTSSGTTASAQNQALPKLTEEVVKQHMFDKQSKPQ